MKKNKISGSITIYIGLIFTTMLLFIGAFIEGARLIAAKTYMDNTTVTVAKSIEGSYVRELFNDYGVMFFNGANNEINTFTNEIYNNNLEIGISNWNLYKVKNLEINVDQTKTAVNDGGIYFLEQVKKYMKYKIPVDLVEKLIKKFNNFNEAPSKEITQESENLEKEKDELEYLSDELMKYIKKIRKVKGNPIQFLNNITKDDNEKTIKNFKLLQRYVKNVDKLFNDAMNCVTDYENKEKEILNKYSDICVGDTNNIFFQVKSNKKIIDILKLLTAYSKQDIKDYYDGTLEENKQKRLGKILISAKSAVQGYTFTKEEVEKSDESLLDNIKKIFKDGKLALVVEDVNKISDSKTNIEDLSSITSKNTLKSNVNITDKAILCLYISNKFGCYTKKINNTGLKYEIEYVLCGKNNDKDNLDGTVNKLLLIREGFNLAHIFTDKEKNLECLTMATTISGWTGVPLIVSITKYIIMSGWALGEAVLDVKSLLAGNKVEVVKTNKNWKLDLKDLISLSKDSKINKNKKGLNYEEYLQVMLMLQNISDNIFKTMDLIEINLEKRYKTSLRFSDLICEGKVECNYNLGNIFMKFGLCKSLNSNIEFKY